MCSDHFGNDMFCDVGVKKRLKATAVPFRNECNVFGLTMLQNYYVKLDAWKSNFLIILIVEGIKNFFCFNCCIVIDFQTMGVPRCHF